MTESYYLWGGWVGVVILLILIPFYITLTKIMM